MHLPITPLRQQLEDLLHPAEGRGNKITFDSMQLLGLEIVERRNPNVDMAFNYKCPWFVFGKTLQEPWFNPQNFSLDLFDDTTSFLQRYGFEQVYTLAEGNVITYSSVGEMYHQAHHFGIFQQSKVISKFGIGHVFRHEIEQVPVSYGQQVLFYRRS